MPTAISALTTGKKAQKFYKIIWSSNIHSFSPLLKSLWVNYQGPLNVLPAVQVSHPKDDHFSLMQIFQKSLCLRIEVGEGELLSMFRASFSVCTNLANA